MRRLAAGLTFLVLLGAASVAVNPPRVSQAAVISSAVDQAAAYAAAHGYSSAIGVEDTKTGQYWGGGDDSDLYATNSVVKVFIATRVLAMGLMHGADEALAWKMITQSDNASAQALYDQIGGNSLMSWIKARYDIPYLGTAPLPGRGWGNTHITAHGMVTFYKDMKADRVVAPWLLNAMHHAVQFVDGGFNQFWGIPSATTGAAIKQGWDVQNADRQNKAGYNSTGLVNGDRYAVAILTTGPLNTYGAPIAAVITAQAKLLMPGGKITNPATHNPLLHVDKTAGTHGQASIQGWAYDLDALPGTVAVSVREGTKLRASVRARLARPDVDRAQHIHGAHGFDISFPAAKGPHVYCLTAHNLGAGAMSTLSCVKVTISS